MGFTRRPLAVAVASLLAAGIMAGASGAAGAAGAASGAVDGVGASADLGITKDDGVSTFVPGNIKTYSIVASNSGPSAVSGATVTDNFPAALNTCNWSCSGSGGGTCAASGSGNISDTTVNLPVGGSVTYSTSCFSDSDATGTLSNTATVSAPGGVTDPNPGNDSATDTDTLTPSAGAGLTKTDGVTAATPGGSVTYTIVAASVGPSNIHGATVTDTFPPVLTCTWTCEGHGTSPGGTCGTASGSGNINDTVELPHGTNVTYTATCVIAPSATGTLSNTATLTLPPGITDLGGTEDNTQTDTDTLTAPLPGDVTGTKTASGSFATGGEVVYTVVLTENGPGGQHDNPGDELSDTLPPELTLVSATADAGVVATAGNTVTWNGFIPADLSVTITIHAIINAPEGAVVSNQGTILYDADGNGTNEATRLTDDPATNPPGDATTFVVGGSVAAIPALGWRGLLGLAALLAALGALWLRRG